MSDLGAIFHVKKDGVQYDAHAYTTLDECPEPNLKIKFNGSLAYIKLEAKGSGDVPCYVKTKAGNTYQVKKEAVPTGSVSLARHEIKTITIPAGVKVVMVTLNSTHISYIGVTAGAAYNLEYYTHSSPSGSHTRKTKSIRHNKADGTIVTWASRSTTTGMSYDDIPIQWSPEINKHAPNIKDYIE